MKIRIAFGAILGLAAAFAFVFLQFRAEAIAQQPSPEEPQPVSADAFGSSDFTSDNDGTPSDPAAAFASDSEASAVFKKPSPEDSEFDSGGPDPFSSEGDSLPEPDDAFGIGSAFETDDGGAFASQEAPVVRQYPLRIIRLRTVRAVEVRTVIESLFLDDTNTQRWFLTTEDQSNSLIFKGPTGEFDLFKKIASELDRLAETPVDPRKKTRSWPVPHVIEDSPESTSRDRLSQWPIRIIRLRNLIAKDFTRIAWDLANSQNAKSQLKIFFEPGTNSVVVRGPVAEISQVEQLAQQLDQPPDGNEESDFAVLPDRPSERSSLDPFAANSETVWETLQAPADRAKELREQVAQLDARSVDLAREIRSLQKRFAGQHPKIIDARGELESLLEKAFQSRLQIQSIEVSILKNRLQNIESRVHQRAQLRKQIIDRRLHELLGEQDDLSWEVTQPDLKIEFDSSENLPGPGGTILEPSSPAQQP